MKIEWASDFHRDGSRRRRPIASTMHGWLAKMRGTLTGDEKLRSQGMREMERARAERKSKKSQGKSSGGVFSFFGSKRPQAQRKGSGGARGGSSRPGLRQGNSSHRLVGQSSQRGSGARSRGSKRPSGPSRKSTRTSQRSGTSRRSSKR
ncbi:hypothetical protein BT96DRAFT_469629 [Gymnopus androsaceus JB14]|uniref:Uncharacterized protein n=1 Tax=Gymnopus androsaceus JB14 TaxID=1447944 RepID=A0A6A4IHN8_9AGAR|nr:hypothetical protein BT96DRAFT_469629 [Gymnopus androsaceus JB14]